MSDAEPLHSPADEGPPTARRRSSSATPPVGRWWLVVGIGLLVLAVDQLTKWWALVALDGGRVVDVGLTLTFRLARNTGAAFSMGSGSGITRFLPLIVLAVVIGVVVRSRSLLTRTGAVALGMILGGAIGNLVDRALRTEPGGGLLSGGVIDFIAFTWWPVFNVADMGVVVGGILFAVVAFLTDEDRPSRSTPASDDDAGAP